MSEIWKDVIGWEGIYQVSNLGKVKSLDRLSSGSRVFKIKGRIMSQTIHRNGYYHVTLYKNNIKKCVTVHSLVAKSFLGHNTESGLVVNHIDHNRLNNNVENLELVTQRENCSKRKYTYTSKYTGVIKMDKTNNWRSSINTPNGVVHLGTFYSEEEAYKYYLNAVNSVNNGLPIKTKLRKNTSKYKGVSHRDNGRWRSFFYNGVKTKHIGYFDNEEDAVEARNAFIIKHNLPHPIQEIKN